MSLEPSQYSVGVRVEAAVHRTYLFARSGDVTGAERDVFGADEDIWIYGTLRDEVDQVGVGDARIYFSINGEPAGSAWTDRNTGDFRHNIGTLPEGSYTILCRFEGM